MAYRYMCPRCHFPRDLVRGKYSFIDFPLPAGLLAPPNHDWTKRLQYEARFKQRQREDELNLFYCCQRCHFPYDVLPPDYRGLRLLIPVLDISHSWIVEPLPERSQDPATHLAYSLSYYGPEQDCNGGQAEFEDESDQPRSGERFAAASAFRNPANGPYCQGTFTSQVYRPNPIHQQGPRVQSPYGNYGQCGTYAAYQQPQATYHSYSPLRQRSMENASTQTEPIYRSQSTQTRSYVVPHTFGTASGSRIFEPSSGKYQF